MNVAEGYRRRQGDLQQAEGNASQCGQERRPHDQLLHCTPHVCLPYSHPAQECFDACQHNGLCSYGTHVVNEATRSVQGVHVHVG